MMSRLGSVNKLLCVAALLLLPQLAYAGSFKVGSIGKSPVAETRKFWPLASYLSRQLQSQGIDGGKVVVADNIHAMSSMLQTRKVDLYIDSIFPSFAVSRLSGSKPMLRRWKMGKSEYRAVIFTRKDSGIARLENLKGKVIAFEEPSSSSGYFFPKVDLLKMKFRLARKKDASEPVKSEELGYIFSHGDSQTILLVLNQVVAAGAIDDQKYHTLAKRLHGFKTLHETVTFPRQVVSYRADLPAKLATRIKNILLNMHRTNEGKRVLQDFESTTMFDEIPAGAIELMAGLEKYIDAEIALQR